MAIEEDLDLNRRNLLATTCVVGGAGCLAAVCALVSSIKPTDATKVQGGAVEVDISALGAGEMKIVSWQGKPVWVLRRTAAMLDALPKLAAQLVDPNSEDSWMMAMPIYCKNIFRSRIEHKEILVCVGVCTHLGCSPVPRFHVGAQPSLPEDWVGGFLCPCHESTFDLAGRIFKNKAAPLNLDIPPYMFLSDTRILIGQDRSGQS